MESFAPQEGAPFGVAPMLDQSQVYDYGADAQLQFGGDYYGGDDLMGGMDDSNEAKRRRIARVHPPLRGRRSGWLADSKLCRRATCAGRRRSNATARCPPARTARTTKPSASSRKSRRSATHQKGSWRAVVDNADRADGLTAHRAKYIEGLENRLGRMEQLLRMTGILEKDDDRTDLGTLEKRLTDKANGNPSGSSVDSPAGPPTARSDSPAQQDAEADVDAAASDRRPSTGRTIASPKSQIKQVKKEPGEVEALSEMMCSLVTNHRGEARYIGASPGSKRMGALRLTIGRLIVRLLDLLAQRYTMGQRESRRRVLPADDGG